MNTLKLLNGRATFYEKTKSGLKQVNEKDGIFYYKKRIEANFKMQQLCYVLLALCREQEDNFDKKKGIDYRDFVSIKSGYYENKYTIENDIVKVVPSPKTWSYFDASFKDLSKLCSCLKRFIFERFSEKLEYDNSKLDTKNSSFEKYHNKYFLLKIIQNNKCKISEKIFQKGEKGFLHHFLIHNTKPNKMKYPNLINSILNLMFVDYAAHEKNGHFGMEKDEIFLSELEILLTKNKALNEAFNRPILSFRLFKVVENALSFYNKETNKYKKNKLKDYLFSLNSFDFKE